MLPVPNPFVIPGARFREVSCSQAGFVCHTCWAHAVSCLDLLCSLPDRSWCSCLLLPLLLQIYYWDSYWVLKGLLASNLTTLAEASCTSEGRRRPHALCLNLAHIGLPACLPACGLP